MSAHVPPPSEAWDFSCPDWFERLKTGRSLVPDLPLDESQAEKAIRIYNQLRLPDVPGKPRLEDAGGAWFRDIVAAIFGSLDPETGERRVGETLLLVPKKNSKTTGGAAIMVTALLMNKRPRAEFLLIGPTQAISDLAFGQAQGMIEADDYLAKRFKVREHVKEIIDRLTKAKLKVKTFDAKVLTGVKPVGVLIDELHELGKMADAARIIGQIRGGLVPNPEGFLIFITTQSDEPPRGIFRSELIKARAIRDGKVRGRMLPILYEFPEDWVRSGAWKDPANWFMVTPNNGRSITVERLKQDWHDAQLAGEEEIRRWASQHLNIEIGVALASDHWAGAEYWESSADPELTLEELIERSEVITVGIDGGGLDDLLGLGVVGRDAETREWLSWCKAWAHPIVLRRRKEIASKLQDLEKSGDLVFIEQIGEDIEQIVEIISTIEASGKLDRIGLDPVGIGGIVDALADKELDKDIEGKDRIVGISQGWRLNGAIKTAERKLADGTMWHADQPLMSWSVGNARVEPKGNAVTITKQKSGSAKIDPLMGLFNAVSLMSLNPQAKGPVGLDDFLQHGVMA